MTFHKFQGHGAIAGASTNPLITNVDSIHDPQGYRAGKDLVNAVNVALALQMPLLLTGEPGTGKTQLAYRLAAELGKTEVLRFNTKSSSQVTDLFYHFDNIRQFGQSQLNAITGKPLPESKEFIRFSVMGEAILRTLDPAEIEARLGPEFCHEKPTDSIVMIDEIDKAPRDFPNDLLNQIEDLEFSVPELGHTFKANRRFNPIVIITSNSEKQLPEAFLRRCVYHHIEFPKDATEVDMILGGRLQQLQLNGFAYREALKLFFKLRDHPTLIKKPSTSELLNWLSVLSHAGLVPDKTLVDQKALLESSLGVLFKISDDIEIGKKLIEKLLA